MKEGTQTIKRINITVFKGWCCTSCIWYKHDWASYIKLLKIALSFIRWIFVTSKLPLTLTIASINYSFYVKRHLLHIPNRTLLKLIYHFVNPLPFQLKASLRFFHFITSIFFFYFFILFVIDVIKMINNFEILFVKLV